MKEKSVSIYDYIRGLAAEYPKLPYVFQDPEWAGRRDVLYTLWGDSLPAPVKKLLAIEIMDHVAACLDDPAACDALTALLEEKPVMLCMAALSSRIKLLLSEGLLDRDKLYTFGLRLATGSSHDENVKLGILILGFFDNDTVRKIIRTLGYHSVFTIYAIEAADNFTDCNEFVFHIARHTNGYGKLAAVAFLEPVLFEHQKWLFEHGAFNEAAPQMSAVICLEKADMRAFFRDLELTKDNFSTLSHILAHAAENSDIKQFSQSAMLIEKYVNHAGAYADAFIDLAALAAINEGLMPSRHPQEPGAEEGNGWTTYLEVSIRNTSSELIRQSKWKKAIIKELAQPKHKTTLIIRVLKTYGYVPEFGLFMPLLERNPFDVDLMRYFLLDHPEKYVIDVMDYLYEITPDDVFSEGPLNIKDDEMAAMYLPDIWFIYLLKALRKLHINAEELFLRCLTARFPEVRKEAINALRVFKTVWSPEVLPALERASGIEPDKNIIKRIYRLMGKAVDKPEKEQRYVDTADIKVKPTHLDVRLFKTYIAGTYYRDLYVMRGRIEHGDILYLMREPDNPHDPNAILVTSDDGYVLGYIPRSDNTIPASLMDSGEKLYAIFLSNSLEDGKPEIQIMLSKSPVVEGKLIKFPHFGERIE